MLMADWGGMAATCFFAALLVATSGFGFALLAVPGLLLFAPPGETVQLVLIVSVAVLIFVLPGLHDALDAPLLRRFALGGLVGLPFGLIGFRYADPVLVRAMVGVVVVAFALVLAFNRYAKWRLTIAMHPGRDLAAGAVAGAATALVGIPGPPVVIYLLLADAPPRTTRATLIAFFALCFSATLIANVVTIGVPIATWRLAASLVPLAWAGGFLGRRLGDRLGAATAVAIAICVLAAAGIYTIVTALGLTLS
jgi:uncharacterized protein